VRFIDVVVDELDLSAAGFLRAAPKATGRPGYTPGDLLLDHESRLHISRSAAASRASFGPQIAVCCIP
jgi:hypothetical protein